MKLYEIGQELDKVLEAASENEDINLDELHQLDLAFDKKAEGCIAYIKNLKSDEKALDVEIKRLQAQKKRAETYRTGLTNYVQREMERVEKKRIQIGVHKAVITRSQPTVNIHSTQQVSDEFKEVRTEEYINRRDILNHYKTTGEIPEGTQIVERNHLRIS